MNRSHHAHRSRSTITLLTSLALSLACLIGPDAASEASAERRVTKTTTTTKTTTRRARRVSRSSKRRVARSSTRRAARSVNRRVARRSVRNRAIASRRYSRGSSYRSYRRSRPAVVRHRASRGSVTSSRSGFANRVLFEVGGSIFAPIQGELSSGLHLALGNRIGPIGGVVEAQLAQDQGGARLSDLNAQLRIYLPLGDNAELYPLIGIGEAETFSANSSSHLDLGIGAQLNVNRHLAVGARYSARLIAEEVNGAPANGHNLTAQVAVRF